MTSGVFPHVCTVPPCCDSENDDGYTDPDSEDEEEHSSKQERANVDSAEQTPSSRERKMDGQKTVAVSW